MLLLLTLLSAAFAHGDEHVVEVEQGPRIAMTGEHVDAVLEVPEQGGTVWLWVADRETTAPVESATPHLSLTGPASVELDLQPGPHAGSWTAALPALDHGEWAGTVVLSGAVSDVLAVSSLVIAEHAHDELGHVAPFLPLVIAALGVGLLLGLGLRRAAPMVMVLLAARGQAHGDEHAAPVTVGGALSLPLSSQLLVGLRTTPLEEGDTQPVVRALGRLVPSTGELHLAAPVAGLIEAGEQPLLPGMSVGAGELLLRLRESPVVVDRAALAVQRATTSAGLAAARRELALAARDVERAPGLGEVLSERERLDREQRLRVAEAAVAQAEAALQALEAGAVVALTSPWAGRVSRIHLRPGAVVQAGEPLVDLVGEGVLRAEVRVAEGDAVRAGALASVTVAGETVAARVLDPGQVVDAGGVVVTLELETAVEARPGASVTAWITAGDAGHGLVIPEAATLVGTGAPFVFVKTGPESFAVRDVALGARVVGGREVRGGLREGERLVVAETVVLQRASGR